MGIQKSNDVLIQQNRIYKRVTVLDCFKLKEFADDNFNFDEYSRKFSNG